MKYEDTLQIQMLGEFAIRNEFHKFPQETKKSMQVIMLIAYLIVNRASLTNKSRLMEVLWPGNSADNPEGALRNLVYRARLELKKFYPGEKVECILSKNNSYIWNSELECDLDIVRFERLVESIKEESDLDQSLQQCTKLLSEYKEDFMFEFPDENWIVVQRNYYKNLKLECIGKVAEELDQEQRYEEIINLCDLLDYQEFTNTRIHELKLYAYYKLDRIAVAMSYYHNVIDLYYSRLGIEVSERMKEIYAMVQKSSAKNPVDVNELEREMFETSKDQGTFYCDFDVFKNIYRINVRAAQRSTRARFLVLLTMKDESGKLSEKRMLEESDLLKDIIFSMLRKNDVYSKCNMTQYSMIIATPRKEGCQKAIDRILEKYEQKRTEDCVNVTYQMKPIH